MTLGRCPISIFCALGTSPREVAIASPAYRERLTGFQAGSYARLIDFMYHSTLGLSTIKRRKREILKQIQIQVQIQYVPICDYSQVTTDRPVPPHTGSVWRSPAERKGNNLDDLYLRMVRARSRC